jgi:hypothetical protein
VTSGRRWRLGFPYSELQKGIPLPCTSSRVAFILSATASCSDEMHKQHSLLAARVGALGHDGQGELEWVDSKERIGVAGRPGVLSPATIRAFRPHCLDRRQSNPYARLKGVRDSSRLFQPKEHLLERLWRFDLICVIWGITSTRSRNLRWDRTLSKSLRRVVWVADGHIPISREVQTKSRHFQNHKTLEGNDGNASDSGGPYCRMWTTDTSGNQSDDLRFAAPDVKATRR